MAPRAKPRAKKKPPARGKVVSRGVVATLPRKSKSKKRGGRGDNSGIHALGDDDVLYHQDQLDAARKKMATAQAEVTQLRGVYQNKRKAAKKAGFNTDAYDINVKLEGLDMGRVQVDYADAGRYLKLNGSTAHRLPSSFSFSRTWKRLRPRLTRCCRANRPAKPQSTLVTIRSRPDP